MSGRWQRARGLVNPIVHLAHDPAEVGGIVRLARDLGTPLRIRGGGSWLDAGRPVNARDIIDLSAMRGIVEYNPGDLTLTARAGSTLAEIDEATRPHGQWLPLDPMGDARATLGATLATASCGPLAATIGAPRDLALGLEIVTGEGTIIRAGGRVVKNVAGFDLVRLNVGAWGTIGIITEATVRLRARPVVDLTVALALPEQVASLGEFLRALRGAPLTALAAQLVDARFAALLGVGDRDMALVRLAGNEESVTAQRETLAALGGVVVPGAVWDLLRCSEPEGATTLRLSRRPSLMATVWRAAVDAANRVDGAFVHADAERGVTRIVAARGDVGSLRELVAAIVTTGTCVVERASREIWIDVPVAASDRLSAGVRRAFDPDGILNPGIFGGQG